MSTIQDMDTGFGVEQRICEINPQTRAIQNVPSFFGVEGDENAYVVQFKCPKTVGDGIDLNGSTIRIKWVNAGKNSGTYTVSDLATQGDFATFSWNLGAAVSEFKGNVSFAVSIERGSGSNVKKWHTTAATSAFLKGVVPADGLDYNEEADDAFSHFESRVQRALNEYTQKLNEVVSLLRVEQTSGGVTISITNPNGSVETANIPVPEILVGNVETLPAGQNATVDVSVTGAKRYINFGIPRGDAGVADLSPSLWPEWTSEDQAIAREKIGIMSAEEVYFG